MLNAKQSEPSYFNIDTLAKKTGLTRRTIRYYVQRGLLPPPEGGGRGHYYTEEHLRRVRAIQRWRSQGVPLEKMKQLLTGQEIPLPSPTPSKVPPTPTQATEWIRITIGSGVELNFRSGTLSQEDQRAIEKFILSRIRR